MDLRSIVLAPVLLPLRVAQGLEDLTGELVRVRGIAESLDISARQIVLGSRDLTETTRSQVQRTRELIDGGAELTEVSKQLEADLQVVRSVLPRVLAALDTVERLEGDVEAVADTIEPLQGAAERVGRVTKRLSRSS